jgi:hypothetical protein
MQQPRGGQDNPVEQVVGERPRTEAVTNVNHDLIQTMSEKLDSMWRYDKYIEDAEKDNCAECASLFSQMKEDDQRHVELLRAEIERHVHRQTFR